MTRKQVASLRKFFLTREPRPDVLERLIPRSGKSMDELLPTEDEMYRELRYIDFYDYEALTEAFGKLFVVKLLMAKGESQADAEQSVSETLQIWRAQNRLMNSFGSIPEAIGRGLAKSMLPKTSPTTLTCEGCGKAMEIPSGEILMECTCGATYVKVKPNAD